MGRCAQCYITQTKLNKGQLCKTCFSKKINPEQYINIVNDDLDDKINDNGMVNDLIKENVMKEQIRNEEIITVLKEQIVYMKTEANYKKKIIIESLLTELYKLKKNSNNEHSFYNQEQNMPSKYSPTNTVSMMLSDKYADHDNINESILNSSHLAQINEDTVTSYIMNHKTTYNSAENNIQ